MLMYFFVASHQKTFMRQASHGFFISKWLIVTTLVSVLCKKAVDSHWRMDCSNILPLKVHRQYKSTQTACFGPWRAQTVWKGPMENQTFFFTLHQRPVPWSQFNIPRISECYLALLTLTKAVCQPSVPQSGYEHVHIKGAWFAAYGNPNRKSYFVVQATALVGCRCCQSMCVFGFIKHS